MEREISNGAMLGIVLIALAVVIGTGFAVFAIARGTANDGTTAMVTNLDSIGDSGFSDYDQKVVTGVQVMSALSNFEGQAVAILIATESTTAAGGGATAIADARTKANAGSGVSAAYTAHDCSIPIVETDLKVKVNGTDKMLFMVNYNALLANASMAKASATAGKVVFDVYCWRTSEGFLTGGSGQVSNNNIRQNLSKSGMMEYVPSGARFQSYLIKDMSDTIIGIAFQQVSSK